MLIANTTAVSDSHSRDRHSQAACAATSALQGSRTEPRTSTGRRTDNNRKLSGTFGDGSAVINATSFSGSVVVTRSSAGQATQAVTQPRTHELHRHQVELLVVELIVGPDSHRPADGRLQFLEDSPALFA